MVDAEDKELKARKEREKDELYALDISGAQWQSAPGTEEHEERVEIAYLPGGAVAMRSSLDPGTVLRYTEAEWRASYSARGMGNSIWSLRRTTGDLPRSDGRAGPLGYGRTGPLGRRRTSR